MPAGTLDSLFCGNKKESLSRVSILSAEIDTAVLLKKEVLKAGDIELFRRQIETYIEPELVRHGEKWPEEDHMYTYMTAIYICEDGVAEDTRKMIRTFRYVKNYKLTIRGYSEARILVFDLKNRKVYGNRAAKELVRGYKGML